MELISTLLELCNVNIAHNLTSPITEPLASVIDDQDHYESPHDPGANQT